MASSYTPVSRNPQHFSYPGAPVQAASYHGIPQPQQYVTPPLPAPVQNAQPYAQNYRSPGVHTGQMTSAVGSATVTGHSFGASYTTPQTTSVPNVSSFQSGVPSNGVVSTGVHQAVSQNTVHCISQGMPKSIAQPVPQSMPQGVYQTMPQAQSINAAAPAPHAPIEMGAPMTISPAVMTGAQSPREYMLEKHVQELESRVTQQDEEIRELRDALKSAQEVSSSRGRNNSSGDSGLVRARSTDKGKGYSAVDRDDPIDVRLEEFYNASNSLIPFKRINKGFYRFGGATVELRIINHKLMAQTEDGWNRGKFGTVEKFLVHYEPIERQRAGIE
uniref:Uncharacterized protein n=1 Tax=Noctiluca scintillans TaxID=2966 RepID=A0A7S1A1F2_NOCSC